MVFCSYRSWEGSTKSWSPSKSTLCQEGLRKKTLSLLSKIALIGLIDILRLEDFINVSSVTNIFKTSTLLEQAFKDLLCHENSQDFLSFPRKVFYFKVTEFKGHSEVRSRVFCEEKMSKRSPVSQRPMVSRRPINVFFA